MYSKLDSKHDEEEDPFFITQSFWMLSSALEIVLHISIKVSLKEGWLISSRYVIYFSLPLLFSSPTSYKDNTCVLTVLCTLGMTLWNLSCLEFKFDDTRLSYWHKNKIGRIEIFCCCFLTLLILGPVGCLRAEN